MLASLCAVAQEVGSTVDVVRVPVEEDVLARTIDPASPYYHPRLLGLYLSGERELSLEEYHYLYYGYAYSENYCPLEPIAAEDEVLAAMERVMANPSEENLMQVVECGLKVMEMVHSVLTTSSHVQKLQHLSTEFLFVSPKMQMHWLKV